MNIGYKVILDNGATLKRITKRLFEWEQKHRHHKRNLKKWFDIGFEDHGLEVATTSL